MRSTHQPFASATSAPVAQRLAWLALCVVCACVSPKLAAAQDLSAPPALPDGGDEAASEFAGSAGGDLSFGKLGEDFYTTVYLATSFAIGKLSFGIQVPLRIRVIDEDPQDSGVIRAEDWDEISDYLRVIRFVQWSQPGDIFYLRVGELSGASIGHGTIMNNYLNVVDIDHFQLGIDTEVNTAYGGGELTLDNVAQPEIIGTRVYTRPWAFIDPEGFLTAWSVGTSVVTDVGAPSSIDMEPTGGPVVDGQNNIVYDADAVTLWGIDTDIQVVNTDIVRVTPYVDNNLLFGQQTGYGFHAGVLTELSLPLDSGASLRLEYQYLGDSYAPQYIDSLYEVQRIMFPSPGAYGPGETPLTKSTAVATQEGAHGYLGQLGVTLLGFLRLTGLYRGSMRPNDNDLLVQLVLPKVSRVKMGVVYAKSGFGSIADAFTLEDAMFQAYGRLNVFAFVDLIAQYTRTWRLSTDETTGASAYEPVDEYSAGVGVSFDF